MERETNISVWQLRLFEGFDTDIIVMQRDEEEVFDDAIHVFFEKSYYDVYVEKATKYSERRYAYHEDKLGEVIYQIFDEKITGLVIHARTDKSMPEHELCDEKYITACDLLGLKDVADSYHFMYTASIERCVKEEAVAHLWTKNVYIIGQLPNFRVKPKEGEKPIFELMTMKRKKNGEKATATDFDYESIKVFLTADSALRFNPDKKPINRYKLSMLSQFVRGRFQIAIEPHREYQLEYDPAKLDLTKYLEVPHFNEEKVKERIRAFAQMEQVYVLLNPVHSDYRTSQGNPFLMKVDEKNIMMYFFENYEDAVNYVFQNQNLLPVLDSTLPIGVLNATDNLLKLETILAVAQGIGVTGVSLDMDTLHAIGCKLEFFMEAAGFQTDIEHILSPEDLPKVMRKEDEKRQYRMPVIPFYDRNNHLEVTAQRREELTKRVETTHDLAATYLAECTIPEMMVMMQATTMLFESAIKTQDEEKKVQYNRLINQITLQLTEALCGKPYIYTLQDQEGGLILKNEIAYLIITNRYEAGRQGEGRLIPVSIDNPQFMEKLCAASKVAALTDGPSVLCLMDTAFMREIAKQWKKAEPLRAELFVYLTQGCGLSEPEAKYYYRRLKSDDSIFIEFVAAVKEGTYPPIGMLTIEGHTAKELSDTYGFTMVEAYDCLLSLKIDPQHIAQLQGEDTITPSAEQTNENQNTKVKKGFFEKLFKK